MTLEEFIASRDQQPAQSTTAIVPQTGTMASSFESWVQEKETRQAKQAATLSQGFADKGFDELAAAHEMARMTRDQGGPDLPPAFFLNTELRRTIEMQQAQRVFEKAPAGLVRWSLEDPTNAVIAKGDIENLSVLGALASDVVYSAKSTVQGFPASLRFKAAAARLSAADQAPADREKSFFDILQEEAQQIAEPPEAPSLDARLIKRLTGLEIDTGAGMDLLSMIPDAAGRYLRSRVEPEGGDAALVEERRRATQTRLQVLQSTMNDLADDRGRTAAFTRMAPVVDRISSDKTLNPGQQAAAMLRAFIDDPSGGFSYLMSTTAESLPGLAVAAAGARFGVSPVLTMDATSFARAETQSFAQVAKDRGFDVNKPEDVLRMFQDPQLAASLGDASLRYSATVALWDALSGAAAGQAMAKSPMGDILLQAMAQGSFGGLGEMAAQLNSGQDINGVEVLLEVLAEFTTAPLEVAAVGGRKFGQATGASRALSDMRDRRVQKRRNETERQFFDALATASDKSDLKAKAPRAYRDAVAAVVDGTPTDTVYADAQAINELMQTGRINPVEFQQLTGLTPEQVAEEASRGGDVQITTADYAAKVVGTPVADALRDHVRIRPDSLSAAEVKAMGDTDTAQLAEQLAAEVAAGETFAPEVEAARARMVEQFRAAGRAGAEAEEVSLLFASQAQTTAAVLGVAPAAYLRRFPIPEVRAGTSPVPSPAPLDQSSAPFQEWFGDSIVRDETGAARQVYHGAVGDFDAFRPGRFAWVSSTPELANTYAESRRDGMLRGNIPYGPVTVMPLYARVTRPFDTATIPARLTVDDLISALRAAGEPVDPAAAEVAEAAMRAFDTGRPQGIAMFWQNGEEGDRAFIDLLTAYGYDAIQHIERGSETFGVFDPAQLKSPFNRGSFDPADARLLHQANALREGTETLQKYGLDPNGRYTTRDIAVALEKRARKRWGQIARDDRSDKTRDKIARHMVDEVMFEVRQAQLDPTKSAVGWYTTKTQAAIDVVGETFPELMGDADALALPGPAALGSDVRAARAFFTALLAVTSDGAKVADNFKRAVQIYGNWRDTAVLTAEGAMGSNRGSVPGNLQKLQEVVDQYGAEGLWNVLLEKRTISELKKLAKEAGVDLGSASKYRATMTLPFSAIVFGPKLGAFYANLMGDTGYLTMDRWWSRTFNRYRGDLLPTLNETGVARVRALLQEARVNSPLETAEDVVLAAVPYRNAYAAKGFKNGTELEKAANTLHKAAFEELNDTPFNASDREFMVATVDRARQLLEKRGVSLTVADIQAVLWYYEKRLYGTLGARQTQDASYEEAARRAAESYSAGRPLDEGAGEPGNATSLDVGADEEFALDDATGGVELFQSAPPTFRLPDLEKASPGPVPGVRDVATAYMQAQGLPVRHQASYVKVDVERAREIARLYDEMEDAPNDPQVRAAYTALARETIQQYRALLELGFTFEWITGEDPYASPREAILDMQQNRHLWVFPTTEGFGNSEPRTVSISALTLSEDGLATAEGAIADGATSQTEGPITVAREPNGGLYVLDGYHRVAQAMRRGDTTIKVTEVPFSADIQEHRYGLERGFSQRGVVEHPLLQPTEYEIDGRVALVNDLFRIVHDVFGHGSEGAAFGARGEENAWQAHVRMFSPLAARAMTSETRGQNSWVNFGPYGEQNRANPANTVFADQKVGLLPEWVSAVGQAEDRPLAEVLGWPTIDDFRFRFGPDLLQRDGWFIVTGMREDFGAQDDPRQAEANARLRATMDEMGLDYLPVSGMYKGEPQGESYLVIGDTATGLNLGRAFNQESILTFRGLEYSDGRPDTPQLPAETVVGPAALESDFYSVMPDGTPWTMGLDWGEPIELFQSAPAVESPAFKEWFGNSAVVDDSGAPLVVYHGTTGAAIEAFDPERKGVTSVLFSTVETHRQGFYFAEKEGFARGFAEQGGRRGTGTVMPVYLSIQNPLDVTSDDNASVDRLRAVIARAQEIDPEINNPDFLLRPGDDSFWETLDTAEGGDVFVQAMRDLGYDGIKMIEPDLETADPNYVPDDTGAVTWVAFDPTQIKSVDNRGTFDPNDARVLYQEKRGSIVLPRGDGQTAVLSIYAGADASTAIHEGAHHFLYVMETLVKSAEAPQRMVDDWRALTDWWRSRAAEIAAEAGTDADHVIAYLDGMPMDQATGRAIWTALHEQTARGFELYVSEGKAPTLGLRSAFEAFRAWLIAVYRTVTTDAALRVQITDDVRLVFDHWIATDAQIAQARVAGGLDREAALKAGVPEGDLDVLARLALEAQDEAKAYMLGLPGPRMAKRMEWRRQREQAVATARAALAADPGHQAVAWLTKFRWLGEGEVPDSLPRVKLDRQSITDVYGEEVAAELAPMLQVDGADQDDLAPSFGFASGDALVQALRATPDFSRAVRARATAELRAARGRPTAADIDDATNGDKRGQQLDAELRALRKAATVVPAFTRRQAALIAEQTIRAMPARAAVKSETFLAAERRAGRRVEEALAKGDVVAAALAKRDQLIQHSLYRESRKAMELAEKTRRRAKRLQSAGTRKNLAGEYLSALDQVLEQYDFRRLPRGAELDRTRLAAFVQMMTDAGRASELAIPASVLAETKRRPYLTLTVAELAGVHDTLVNIEHAARREKKLRNAQRERDLRATVDAVVAELDANLPDKPRARTRTRAEAMRDGLRTYANIALNVETRLRQYAGWRLGAAYDALKADIDAAGVYEHTLGLERDRALERLYNQYSRAERLAMGRKRHHDVLGGEFSQWELISAALNMGNAANLDRLRGTDTTHPFTDAQIEYIQNQLTDRDWDFVEGVWELVDSYWPLIAARERRVTGTIPQKVEAEPFTLPSGRTLRGGYYPIKYDGQLSSAVTDEQLQERLQMMQAGRFGKAQTRQGHLETRVGSGGRVLLLDMGVLHQHLSDVIHDLAFAEVAADTWRVLRDPALRAAFQRKGLQADLEMLEIWTQDTATGAQTGGGWFGRQAMALKGNFTTSRLAMNFSTILLQLTGYTTSVAVVGADNMIAALMQFAGNPRGTWMSVLEQSEFMRHKARLIQPDVAEMRMQATAGPVAGTKGILQRIVDIGMAPIAMVQSIVDIPTWVAAQRKALKQGMTREEAVLWADRAVVRAQGGITIADRTAFERGSLSRDTRYDGVLRLFATLASFMMTRGNLAYEVAGTANRERTVTAGFTAAFHLILLFTVDAMIVGALRGELIDDDDDDPPLKDIVEHALLESAKGALAGMPFVRDAISAAEGFNGGGGYGAISETVGKPLKEIGQGELDRGLLRGFLNAIGLATGLPTGQVNRIIDAAANSGEDDAGFTDYLFGVKR